VYSLVLLAALPGQFVENANFPKEKQQAALEATVRIRHPGSKLYGVGQATGVIVGREGPIVYILTADHVLPPEESGNSTDLYFYTAKSYPKPIAEVRQARVTARMPAVDLAVIQAPLPDHPGLLPICPAEKDKLQGLRLITEAQRKHPIPVMTLGVEAGEEELKIVDGPTIEFDTVRAVKQAKPHCQALFYEADHEPAQGRSGGPLVDKRGYLIGICNGFNRKTGKGYYLYIEDLQSALKKNGFGWLCEGKKPPGK
jgi:hypothetical protein